MFFDRLKELCAEKGISTYKAATDIGLNRAVIAKWKTGSQPSGTTALKLSEYFGVSVDYLLGKEATKAPTVSGERDILDDVDVAFYGEYKELGEDDKETIRSMVRVMRERRAKQQEK